MMGWFIRDVDRGAPETIMEIGTATAFHNDFYQTSINTSDQLNIYNFSSSVTGSVISVGAWNHIAMVVEGTGAGQFKAYLNGVLDITHAGNGSISAAGRMWFGNNNYTEFLNGRVGPWKVWDVALTAAEIAQEFRCIRPVRFANINSWSPCFPGSGERVRDYSGFGRDLTEMGTITDESPPPVSWGASPIIVR